jgi:hypothetical protein
MSYQADILADSISPDGIRLTTFWVTFPRFILAEVNTHRMFSRNSNSSRAIPPERQIEKVRTNPFIPETFNSRVKGMGVGDALDEEKTKDARSAWVAAATAATITAQRLIDIGIDKSRINRLLEPFLWHSAIITSTEWSNYNALRNHPDAQPEFQILARMMCDALANNTPVNLDYGMWHLPGLTDGELKTLCAARNGSADEAMAAIEFWKMVSAGRLAKWTSYDKMDEQDLPDVAYARAVKLICSFHLSPTEHQARPFSVAERESVDTLKNMMRMWQQHDVSVPEWMIKQVDFCGNFEGWVQFRKEIPFEHNAALAKAFA